MPYDPSMTAAAALILFIGAWLQSAVGFGYGQLCLPLLLWLGYPLSSAVSLMLASVLIQTAVGAYRLRQDIPWRTVTWSFSIRFLLLPVGVWLIAVIEGLDKASIKQVVGGVVLFAMALQGLFRPTPREKLGRGWDLLAFASSGLLGGAAGMGGPPLILWTMAHDWPSRKTRAFLNASWLLGSPCLLIMLAYRFGATVMPAMVLALILTPVTVCGSYLGIKYGNRLTPTLLRAISFTLLILISSACLLAPLLS